MWYSNRRREAQIVKVDTRNTLNAADKGKSRDLAQILQARRNDVTRVGNESEVERQGILRFTRQMYLLIIPVLTFSEYFFPYKHRRHRSN